MVRGLLVALVLETMIVAMYFNVFKLVVFIETTTDWLLLFPEVGLTVNQVALSDTDQFSVPVPPLEIVKL